MRAEEFVTEVRAGLLNYVKQQFPTWPDYVIQDLLYKNVKNMPTQEEINEYLAMFKQDYGQVRWQLQQLPITLRIFDAETQRKIQQRAGGTKNPYQVPNDAERHATQAAMIQQQGVSREPIIVIKTAQGYDLLEGWHRTIQHLRAFPNGYRGPAWVGIPSVNENFADGKVKGKSRPGRVKRAGASCKGSVTDLRARAKKYSGEKGKMYHWCANMKAGKKK